MSRRKSRKETEITRRALLTTAAVGIGTAMTKGAARWTKRETFS